MSGPSEPFEVWRHQRGAAPARAPDEVAREEPLEIRIAGRAISVTMRTPGHDEELALGFLVGEGVIARAEDVEHVRRCDRSLGDAIDVIAAPSVSLDVARLTRHVFASSSCGICGLAAIDAIRRMFPPALPGPALRADVLFSYADTLRASQPTFERTGGLHAAGLFEPSGRLLVAREDVGRHNAVDKVIGWALRAGRLPLSNHALMVSGRASFEIVQKALGAGVPIVAAVSAPSSLAIDLAGESNITLVGFLRGDRFNVYSHPERILAQSNVSGGADGKARERR